MWVSVSVLFKSEIRWNQDHLHELTGHLFIFMLYLIRYDPERVS